MTVPEPSPAQQAIADSLVGLPYVCLVSTQAAAQCYCGQLRNGDKVRYEQIEDIWNAGLFIEAFEGRGAATQSTASGVGADNLHWELVSLAEKLYGCRMIEALEIWRRMPRHSYGTLADRPRVLWPRPLVN